MNTKIVYAIVSNISDFYLEQALLSVHSLRMYNPEAVVELVVDESTVATIEGKRAKIREYVSEIHVVKTPEGMSPVHRSRYLKTNLREFVQGDFLFIDCDTIICDSLADIDKIDAEIAMVADLNGELSLKDAVVIARCKQAGFGSMDDLPYFNSGVIYAKDTPKVHQFYEKWHNNWKQSAIKGVKYDQPALCATNATNGKIIQELDGTWNCQFKMKGYLFLKKAKIMHYYSNNGEKEKFFTLPMDMLYQQVREEGITPLIDKLVRHAKTDLFAVMTVNDEQYMKFFYSHQLYLYTNRPFVYRVLGKIGKSLEKIIYK